jgi:hypothetical protein
MSRGGGDISLNNSRVVVNNLVFKNLSRAGTPDIVQINFDISFQNNFGSQGYNYSKSYIANAQLYK